jgi:hypothetical protein
MAYSPRTMNFRSVIHRKMPPRGSGGDRKSRLVLGGTEVAEL